jgi:hypothetical protein
MGLITNFAAGELSANLYGRIDLPQYHSGAARLENWDVIPTGGIKRRSGFRRIGELAANEKTRLIPVIISREEKYLLVFSHEKIAVYKAGENKPFLTFTNANVSPGKLYAENEISEVQYAQSQNLVIFAHQNHPPLLTAFYSSDVSIGVLNIFTLVSYEHEPGLFHGFGVEEDKYYKRGYLRKEGQYPKCAAFFNGRLVFAATEFDRQRLFFSHVNSFSDFSTYKTFITEVKYVVEVRCKITMGSPKVQFVHIEDAEKIINPDNKTYYTDSRFFPEGTRMLIYPHVEGDGKAYMEFDRLPQNIIGVVPDGLLADLNKWEAAFNSLDANPYEFGDILKYSTTGYFQGSFYFIKIFIGASFFRVENNGKDLLKETVIIPPDIMGRPNYYDDIKTLINNACDKIMKQTPGDSYGDIIDIAISGAVNQIITHSNYLLKFSDNGSYNVLAEKTYYGYMPEIKKKILNSLLFTSEAYIILFTRELKKDDVVTPDCGFTFEISSGKNDAIKWLSVNRGIIVGTELSEFAIPPDIHAGNVQAMAISKYGSDNISGEAVGAATVFFQSGRKGLVEYYPNDFDQFRANNMALLASQMLHESPAKEFDFATAPYTRLFIVREDGVLVTLLYERATGTFAWNRITTGEVTRDTITPEEVEIERKLKDRYRNSNPQHYDNSPFEPPKRLKRFIEGKILSCAVLPGGDGFDDVYLIVKRGGRFYLERLEKSGTVYLDGWREWKWGNESQKRELLESYSPDAVIYDENKVELYNLNAPTGQVPQSEEGNRRYIGYPYKSVMKSMPVVKNEKMGPVNMSAMCVRLLDSYEPCIWERETSNSELGKELHDGVIKVTNILSGQSRTMQFHITHDAPNRCCVLSVYTEV